MTTPLLAIDKLSKSYGMHQALRDVTFAVGEGELFGLLGPNGAGKTTLMSILSCLMEGDSGVATLMGRGLGTRQRDVRRLIGLVPQELAIYNELTARENLQFFGDLYGVPPKVLGQRVQETLAAIGLADRATERVGGFSGGMKRRLNFGIAVIHQPRLLLLDEPTTGVDPQSRNHIFEEVRRLNRAGMAMIYTSHYMEEVQALCPRIGIIDHGQLIASDTLAGLLRRLPGSIRIRLVRPMPDFQRQLALLDGVHLKDNDGVNLELEAADVKPVLLQLVGLMAELGNALAGVEIQEPNLERVFLHLTGRALRD